MEAAEFQRYLETHQNLAPRTVKEYVKIFRKFSIKQDFSVEAMNKEIKRYSMSKAIMYHILFMLERYEDIAKLVRAKQIPVKRQGVYLDKETLKQIIPLITDTTWRTLALIQYVTGIRAADGIRLKKESFKQLETGDIKVIVIGKGDKERIVFIPKIYADQVMQFVQNTYWDTPFIKTRSIDMATAIETNYHYYYMAIKKAVKILGITNEFATHDFRRNFADEAYEASGRDIRVVRDILGHAHEETTVKYFRKKLTEEETKKIAKMMRGEG